jgi:class 3 adenylate cyclase/tetratricopeptide (TPR) repeat protein
MSEKLDPEEVKGITSRIFGEIAKVIDRYEGFVEKYAGDAVMAVFGVPRSHEDDPVRAIKAAIEVHELVERLSPQLEEKVGRPLSMHSGINTGLVVTGEVNLEKGTHGLMGDAVNTAARIMGLAKTGEILVGHETTRQSEGYFDFEKLEPAKLKGKAEPVHVYRMISARKRPLTTRRLSGFKAELIGRKAEMARLQEAFQQLKEGKGSIVSICGDAGTGKSRLVEVFKATLDPDKVQMLEGHAYAYSQNTPYSPLIDFLNRVFRIEEADPPEKVREKVQSGVEGLLGNREHTIPFIGSLYSLNYPEMEGMAPELWKYRLQDGVKAILSALAQKMPTIFFLEDLHWADSSFLELLRQTISEIQYPALVIAAYRLPFSLLTSHQQSALSRSYHEIKLQDLSSSEAQDMVGSLLKTDTLPSELSRFVQDKAEGNPFYLEEVINSLIESEVLVKDDGKWRLTREIRELSISSTVHGVISARLDRLEKDAKRVLQEASVIGRVFLYDILKRITVIQDQVEKCLSGLERLDLIRTRSLHPDLEYIFKHALTQEAVYNGLLKKERQEIHERIGLVMEQLFCDRLPEFYEALAYHFRQGQSAVKAVKYLMKAGLKSLSRSAVEESYRYYKEAFELLYQRTPTAKDEQLLLIDLLNEWGATLTFKAAFDEMITLFKAHEGLAVSIQDKQRLGMFYTWIGGAFHQTGQFKDSYTYLRKSLELGELTRDQKIIGYACSWLALTCGHIGYLDEAVKYGERARDLILDPRAGLTLFDAAHGLVAAYWCTGDIRKLRELGTELVEQGTKRSDPRCLAVGEIALGHSHLSAGDSQSAVEFYKKALKDSIDPMLINMSKSYAGTASLANGQYQDALSLSQDVMRFSEKYGFEVFRTGALLVTGCALAATGDLGRGLDTVGRVEKIYLKMNNRWAYAATQMLFGTLYLQIVEGKGPKSLSFMVKNIRSLIRVVPGAAKKSEEHFNKAIEIAGEIGARCLLGQSHLGLGLLHSAKGRKEKARESISKAIEIFEEIEADGFLKQANEALDSLE